MLSERLKNKIALITGGGRGIGKVISLAFAKEGADIVVTSRTESEIRATADKVEDLGRRSLAITCDITKPENVRKVISTTLDEFNQIDILVNNAGVTEKKVDGKTRKLWELPTTEWLRVIDINLTGTFLVTKLALKYMIQRKEGNIINISSLLAYEPNKDSSCPYVVSKAGMESLTRYLSKELIQYRINVNALYLGTPVLTGFFDYLPEDQKSKLTDPKIIAKPAALLASLEPGTLTGHSINAKTWYIKEV